MARYLSSAVCFIVLLFLARPARAEPWFGWGENAAEDRYAEGDIDEEDLVAHATAGRAIGAGQRHAGSWLSVDGFVHELAHGKRDYGAFLVLGFALDRVAEGKVHVTHAFTPAAAIGTGPSSSPVAATAGPIVTPSIARRAVAAAWRSSGLGTDDARVDSMIARSRASAILPEARLRVMRVFSDQSRVDIVPDTTGTYAALNANLYLEARLTWRLDRLLFADDEPTLERVRLERHDARARIAAKVLDALFAWQRAARRQAAAIPGTDEASDAALQAAELVAALDVLTGGWFGSWREEEEAHPP